MIYIFTLKILFKYNITDLFINDNTMGTCKNYIKNIFKNKNRFKIYISIFLVR